MTSSEPRYRVSVSQISSEVGTETVILDVTRGMYYGLNPVGTRLWQLLQEPRTATELCAAVRAEFDVDAETCRRDVQAILDKLLQQNLVRPEEATSVK